MSSQDNCSYTDSFGKPSPLAHWPIGPLDPISAPSEFIVIVIVMKILGDTTCSFFFSDLCLPQIQTPPTHSALICMHLHDAGALCAGTGVCHVDGVVRFLRNHPTEGTAAKSHVSQFSNWISVPDYISCSIIYI